MKNFLFQHNGVIALGLSCLLMVNGGVRSLQSQLMMPVLAPMNMEKVALTLPKPVLSASCDKHLLVSNACSLQVISHHGVVNLLEVVLISQVEHSDTNIIHL